MKREITFGGRSALLCVGEGRAILTVHQSTLPVKLADYLDNAGDITVIEVFKQEDATCIRMIHDLSPSDIFATICEAIAEVYDVNITVLQARLEGVV